MSSVLPAAVWLLACLNMMDGLTTYIGLMGRVVEEQNIIAAAAMAASSIFMVAIVAKALVSLCIVLYIPLRAFTITHTDNRWLQMFRISVDLSVLICVPYYLFIVINNTTEIIKGTLWIQR